MPLTSAKRSGFGKAHHVVVQKRALPIIRNDLDKQKSIYTNVYN